MGPQVSPTSLARALIRQLVGADAILGLDEPDPVDLEGGKVYIQLYVLDGYEDRFEQHPEIDVHVYSRSFRRTEQIALLIQRQIVRYPVRVQVDGKAAILDRSEVTTFTREIPWDADASVTRFHGSYQLQTRS